MEHSSNDLVNLLINRNIFYKQYYSNTIELLKSFYRDKLAVVLYMILFGFIAYQAIKTSIFIPFFLIAILVLSCMSGYYAFRAHAYDTFMKEKDQLTLSFREKIMDGKINAVYIPETTAEISGEIKSFLKNDPIIYEQLMWLLNTHFRRGLRTEFEKRECLISDAVKDKFNIEIEFNKAKLEQVLVFLGELRVTQAYNNYEQWKKLKFTDDDIPWMICRIIAVSCLIGCILFFLFALMSH